MVLIVAVIVAVCSYGYDCWALILKFTHNIIFICTITTNVTLIIHIHYTQQPPVTKIESCSYTNVHSLWTLIAMKIGTNRHT